MHANGISTLAQSRFNQSRLFKIIFAFRDFKKYHRVIFHSSLDHFLLFRSSLFPLLFFSSLSFSLPLPLPRSPPPFRAIFCLLRFVQIRVSRGETRLARFLFANSGKIFRTIANKCPPPMFSDIVKHYSKIRDAFCVWASFVHICAMIK